MLQNKKQILIIAIAEIAMFVVIIISALSFIPKDEQITQQQITQQVQLPHDEPIQTRVVSSLRVRKDIKNFAKDVDVILIGTVKAMSEPRQNKPGAMIYSNVIIEVEEYLKNAQPGREIVIKRHGGRLGNEEVVVEDEPEFKSGERVLLFLGTDFKRDFVVYAGDYGKFTIDNDIAIGSENERLSPLDLIGQIKANIK